MPNGDPWDIFSYTTLTLMMYSYILLKLLYVVEIASEGNTSVATYK